MSMMPGNAIQPVDDIVLQQPGDHDAAAARQFDH